MADLQRTQKDINVLNKAFRLFNRILYPEIAFLMKLECCPISSGTSGPGSDLPRSCCTANSLHVCYYANVELKNLNDQQVLKCQLNLLGDWGMTEEKTNPCTRANMCQTSAYFTDIFYQMCICM